MYKNNKVSQNTLFFTTRFNIQPNHIEYLMYDFNIHSVHWFKWGDLMNLLQIILIIITIL